MTRSRKYTREVLAESVVKCHSFSELMQVVGIHAASGGSHSLLKIRVQEYGLDVSHFHKRPFKAPARNRLKPSEILIVKTGHRRAQPYQLRWALAQSGVPVRCNSCGIGPEWNNSPLTLEVDHINGDWRDCRLENLQFLCPNCHTQKSQAPSRLCSCGAKMNRKALKCKACHMSLLKQVVKHPEKVVWPSKDVLQARVWQIPVSVLALEMGVSGPAIKKRCKRWGIDTPPRGYWQKRMVA